MLATSFSAAARSPATLITVASSPSARAISNSSAASRNWLSSSVRLSTTPSRDFFSRPSSCARLASLQTSGSSSCLPTSISRACLVSKSKIPPHFPGALAEVDEMVGEGVEFFGFHDRLSCQNCVIILSPECSLWLAPVACAKLFRGGAGKIGLCPPAARCSN